MANSKKRLGAKQYTRQQIQPSNTKEVKIRYKLSEDLPCLYSDNLLVQHRDGMFFLHFMLNRYPFVITSADLVPIKEINSTPVAQITTSPVQFARNIIAMQENLKKFLESTGFESKTPEDFLKEILNENEGEKDGSSIENE